MSKNASATNLESRVTLTNSGSRVTFNLKKRVDIKEKWKNWGGKSNLFSPQPSNQSIIAIKILWYLFGIFHLKNALFSYLNAFSICCKSFSNFSFLLFQPILFISLICVIFLLFWIMDSVLSPFSLLSFDCMEIYAVSAVCSLKRCMRPPWSK